MSTLPLNSGVRPLMMDDDAACTYVEALLDYQFDLLWRRQFGVNHAEFLFAEAARELALYPAVRVWFMQLAERSMVQQYAISADVSVRPTDYVPDEFVFYLAHLTRWPEFEALAQRMRERPEDVWSSNLRTRWSVELRGALSDAWEDREFYEVFGGSSRV